MPATDRWDRVFPSPHHCSQKTQGPRIPARGAKGQDGAGQLGSRGGGGSGPLCAEPLGSAHGRESISGSALPWPKLLLLLASHFQEP